MPEDNQTITDAGSSVGGSTQQSVQTAPSPYHTKRALTYVAFGTAAAAMATVCDTLSSSATTAPEAVICKCMAASMAVMAGAVSADLALELQHRKHCECDPEPPKEE